MDTEKQMPEVYEQSNKASLEAHEWEITADSFSVTRDEEYHFAVKCLTEIKTKMKDLDEQRRTATKPLLDAKRAVDSWFKPAVSSLRVAEKSLKESIGKYQAICQAKAKAVLQEVSVAIQEGNQEVAEKKLATLKTREMPKVSGVMTREAWKFEVDDVHELPREYLIPDLKKIGGVVRTLKGGTKIPGVVVRVEKSVVCR